MSSSQNDTKIALLEQSIGHINETLLRIEKKLETVDSDVKSNFKWILGIFIPLFLTGTAATILTILFK